MAWETAKLGEVCTIEKGNIGIMKAVPGEFPLVVLGEERRSHNEYQFNDEAVIIPLVSSTGHGHRSMKRIFFQSGKFAVGSILCAVIPKNKTTLSAEFLYRYLDFNKERELVARMKGMANVSLPIKEIAAVEIPLPPLAIQQQLIARFQEIESGKNQISSELKHQLTLVKELRQAYLREAMQGQLVAQDERDEQIKIPVPKTTIAANGFDARVYSELRDSLNFPAHWAVAPLARVASAIVDCPHSTPKWTTEGMICIRTNQFYPGSLDLSDVRFVSQATYLERIQRLEPIEDDILYSREGGILGVACRVPANTQLCLGQRMMLIRAGTTVDARFLEMVLNSPLITEIARNRTIGGAAPRINVATVKAYPIPLPPLAEQKRIVVKLKTLMKHCDELEASIRQGSAHAETLLQVALKEALAG